MRVWNKIEKWTTNASSKINEKSTKVHLRRFWEILQKMWNIKIKCGVSRMVIRNINLSKCEKRNMRNIWRWANAKNLTGNPEASVARRLSASAWNTFSNKIQAMILMTLLQNIFKNAAHLGEGVSVWPVADHLLRDVGVVEKTRLQRWWCNVIGGRTIWHSTIWQNSIKWTIWHRNFFWDNFHQKC